MRIIKRGVPVADRKYRHTCTSCDTVFEFATLEASLVRDQRDGDYLSIECPVCDDQCAVDVNTYITK